MPSPYYTDVARVLSAEPPLTTVTSMTSAQLFLYVADAESIVNAMLARTYTVPVTGSPPVLVAISTDLSIYRALRRVFSGERMKDSQWVKSFKDAMDMLGEIARGEIPLVTASGALIESRSDYAQVYSSTQNYVPTFSELDMVFSEVDPGKIDDLLAERDFP